MRAFIGLTVLAAMVLGGPAARPSLAADAEVTYVITNGGTPTDNGQVHYVQHGHHDGPEVAWAGSGGSVTLPEGSYDVHVSFSDGAAEKSFWIDDQTFAGKVEKSAEIGLPITEVVYIITNGGTPTDNGQVHYVQHGHHDGPEIAWAGSGSKVRMPEGAYDAHISFRDGAAEKSFWVDDQTFTGKVEKTAEIGLPVARVRYVITNGGAETPNGQVHYFAHGHHDGPEVAWSGTGGTVHLPAGSYDVHVLFEDGPLHKEKWLDDQAFTGTVERAVEVGANEATATVRYHITNGGIDVEGAGQVHYRPAGHHDGPEAGWAGSGGPVRILAGAYDVLVTFIDGAAHKKIWLDNQTFAGTVDKTVEIGLPIADVRYILTNGGEPTDRGQVHFIQHGRHDGPEIAWSGSGGKVRMPEGAYDVHVTFNDGAAHKDFWIDDQSFAGKIEKTVEIGLKLTEVRYVILNNGIEAKDTGQVHYMPSGHHEGPAIAWSGSGGKVRMAAGTYDVVVQFRDGFVSKSVWYDNQPFEGKVEKTAELAIPIAEPTVSVTQNGADVGDKARVAYTDPVTHEEIGWKRSGEQARLEAKPTDIHATLFGAEGWLRAVPLAGQQHLTIDIKPLVTEQLRPNAPPPKACTIEVYGVNFDFDKAVLRPDSEPMLQQVLALFTGTPSFSAEVGGHTDNIGAPEYNVKLSDARASAVKTWLIGHGVAAARVGSRGYGDTRPLVPNTTDENRFKNRRVELRTAACR